MKFDRDRLQALLARVQQNSALPRRAAAPTASVQAPAAAFQDAGPASASAASLAPASAASVPRPASTKAAMPVPLELDEPGLDSMAPPSVGPAGNELDLDEPPESGSAPVRVAALHEALDDADHPPLTPPPESGEEPAPKVAIPRDPGPTMAQLGQTIALEEATSATLELDERAPPPSRRGIDQLEMVPPVASYSEELPLPDNAREELDRVRLGQSAEVGPTVHVRPVLSTNVVDFVSAVRSYQPETFAELLDASLRL